MSRRSSNPFLSAPALLAAFRDSMRLLVWGVAVAVVLYLCSGITVVGPNEVGLVLRCGKIAGWVHPPGLLLALPPPFDEVIKVPVKTIQEAQLDQWSAPARPGQVDLDPATQPYSLTGDVNIVRARFVLRYQISDPIEYVVTSRERDALRDAIIYEAAAHVLADMNVDDALTSQKFAFAQATLQRAQTEITRLRLGLHLLALDVKELTPPIAVVPAFQGVVTARLQARTMVEQANAYAATELPGAQEHAFRVTQEADAYAQQVVAQAQGETASFLDQLREYKAHPALVRARLVNDMRQVVLPQAKISLLPPGTGPNNLFFTPESAP
jgi:modulator of FtsH protease HflK